MYIGGMSVLNNRIQNWMTNNSFEHKSIARAA